MTLNSTAADIPAFTQSHVYDFAPTIFTGTRGWQFGFINTGQVARPIYITQLGVFDSGGDGLATSHDVGFWQAGNISGTLLASATVPAGTVAPLVNGFRWVPITPVAVSPSAHSYIVGAQYSAGDGDLTQTFGYPNFAPAVAEDVYAQFGGAESFGSSLSYPNARTSNPENPIKIFFWEPNFMYSYDVPEPSVWVLLSPAAGFLLLHRVARRRHLRGKPLDCASRCKSLRI